MISLHSQSSRLLAALALCCLFLLSGCGGRASRPKEYAYVSVPQAFLRDRVAAVYNKVGTLKNGERVEVLEKSKRFLRVRSERNEIGWVEQRYLVSEQVFDAAQKLASDHAADPVQAPAVTRYSVNLHLTPDRDSDHLYQLKEGEHLELLLRATAEKPITQAVQTKPAAAKKGKEQPPARPMEDWWLVRDSQHRAGWVLARLVDIDVPLEVGQYAEGQRIVAFFPLNHVEDEGKPVAQYLVALTEPRDGLPVDYNQVRVFTWNLKRHRYETAYRDRRLEGVLPIRVGTREFDKEGRLPVFVLRVRDDSGNLAEQTYRLNGVMVRRVLAPGEEKPRTPTRPRHPRQHR